MHSFSHSIPFPGFAFAYIHLPLWSLAIAQDMGSSYFGEPNFGNERASCSSSSRKGKKSHNSDKPKQPQRGLGVAQLEKIRLHGYHPSLHAPYPSNFSNEDPRVQIAYSSVPSSSFSYSSSYAASYGFQPNIMCIYNCTAREAAIKWAYPNIKKQTSDMEILSQLIQQDGKLPASSWRASILLHPT
ncbi:protein SPEAR3 isoform X2 [Glycine max]|uniref:protein SPEAR3 isoform X2 n=1 Tax=Glycine max TaxID=3847 RepID=UPI001B3554BE|nr:protein SPEAR3 isoform X2 [Glycine max]